MSAPHPFDDAEAAEAEAEAAEAAAEAAAAEAPADRSSRRVEAVGAWFGRHAHRAGRGLTVSALVAWYALRDPDTPAFAKGALLGALGYLADPIDAIPDITPLVGYTDDATVLAAALALVAASIKPEHRDQAEARADGIFGRWAPKDRRLALDPSG